MSELHPAMQLACRNAAKMGSITAIVASKDIPSIGMLQKETGDNDLEKVFRYLLAKMREELHIDNGLSNGNIRNIARRLRTDDEIRWWLSVADIRLLCQKIVNGEYGKFYGHFSEQEFYECMIKYCNERNDLHRQQAERHPEPAPSVLQEVNLGYHIGEDGRLVVHEQQQAKKPNRYIYDGSRVRENPEFWSSHGVRREKSPEEIEHMNRSNRFQERVCQIIDRDRCSLADAIMRATEEEAGTQTKLF